MPTNIASLPKARRVTAPEALTPVKRLLLADDQQSIRDSLGRLLRKQGYEVSTAETGAEAVSRSIEERFDLVLLDLSMPGMNGWEALRRIAEARPELPIVIITAHSHQRAWVEPSGAWALLEKPLDVSLLLNTIRSLTEERPCSSPSLSKAPRTRFTHHLARPRPDQIIAHAHSAFGG